MKDKLVGMTDVFHFDAAGTLPRPGPVGRLLRLILGLLLIALVWQLVMFADASDLAEPTIWFWAVFSAMLAPYVINIGWGKTFGAWPRFVFIAIIMFAAGVDYLLTGTPWGNTLWWTLDISMIYILGHLGISFVVSAAIATPGCEMRGLPHLFGIIRKESAAEHYCPGPIDTLDRWELGISAESPPGNNEKQDWLASGKSKLLVYGVPFILIQVVGNFAGLTPVMWTWGLGFGLPGIFCILNALRCQRVHCYFIGPVLLGAGILTFLMGLEVIDFGRQQFTYLLNITILLVILLYSASERIWGKYFGEKETINET